MRPILCLALASALLAGCDFSSSDPDSLVGTSPDFKVESLKGGDAPATLKSFQGKAVLIDFWATWCGPCRQLSPYIESTYEKYKDKGLEGMAVSGEDRQTLLGFEAQDPHKMPVFLDPNQKAEQDLKIEGLPTILVVDRTGKITYATAGFDPVNINKEAQDIDDAVAKALAG